MELNLRSIEKFCSGFNAVNLLVPQEEAESFLRYSGRNVNVKTYPRDVSVDQWHLKHQVEKCRADRWCPDADLVLHTDSDCMFIEPVTPEDYLLHGKPIMLYDHYSRLDKGSQVWKSVTEGALRRPVHYEFMRRHPQVNPIGVYPKLREYIEKVQTQDFDDFVLSRKPTFPWGFSEHNAIGAFAYYDEDFHEQYAWHNVSGSGFPREKLIQFWSHSDIDTEQNISHGGLFTPRLFAEKVLA